MKFAAPILLILLSFTRGEEKVNWYTIKFQSLCDEPGRQVTPERAAKRGTLKAYNIREQKIAGDTTQVSFEFISNCCETHSGTAEIADSTLILSYYRTNAEACRCLCDYRLTYSISDTTLHWRSVSIKRLEKKK